MPQVIDQLVGQTACVLLQRVVPRGAAQVWLKLETRSPNATFFDRVARHWPKPDGAFHVTGHGALAVAVAMQGALQNIPVEATLPDDTPLEVRQTLLTYAAKVTLAPFGQPLQPELTGLREAAEEVARELLASHPRLDAVIAPSPLLELLVDSLRAKHPDLRAIAVRPFEGPWRPHRQAGFFTADAPAAETTEVVDDAAAWKMRERLGKEEGLLLSASSAACVEAACREAVRLGPGAQVVTLALDTGERSFSTADQL